MNKVVYRDYNFFVAFFSTKPRLVWFMLLSIGSAANIYAVPLYTDNPWLDVDTMLLQNIDTRKRAQEIRRLTDYIHKTFKVTPDRSVAIITEAVYHADKHAIQPELILAIIAVESTFREKAVSPAGAMGLMQIMPSAHPQKVASIGGKKALFERKNNIAMGVLILHEYLKRSNGNLNKALLRYNGSLSVRNPKYAKKVLKYYDKFRQVIDPDNVS